MAYVKPGVEMTQVQQTVSPNLTTPDLGAVVIAPAYVVVPMEGPGSYTYSQTFSVSGVTAITLSGLTQGSMYLDPNSVYIDLVKTTGATTGRYHLENSQLTGLTAGGTNFNIPSATAQIVGSGYNGAQIRVAWRALNTAVNGFYTVQTAHDLDSIFGNGSGGSYKNPLPFALSLALQNTTTQVFAVPIYTDALGSTTITASGQQESTEHSRAMTILESQEVYGIAPFTTSTPIIQAYTTWVNAQSAATEKHERVVFVSPEITWYDATGAIVAYSASSMDKATTARNIRDTAAVILDRRTFYVRPDVAYYSVSNVPVQELRQSTLAKISNTGDIVFAKLAAAATITNPDGSTTYYPALTDITDVVFGVLLNSVNQYLFDVYIPLKGCFLTPSIVGQVAGQNPEQGLTNLPMSGPTLLKFSNDFFSESHLNTMAAGGNYLVVNLAGAFASRHQLSTNMNSVQERELSITKSVDFVAKYVRNALSGYIGRSLITPGFLSVVGAILNGLGGTLIKNGRINGFTVLSVTQDTVNPDTIRVSIQILPKYPVNYIKIDLIF